MEKQAALRWSAGTANTPSTQSPSSSSSKRSTCVFEKIRKLVWRQQHHLHTHRRWAEGLLSSCYWPTTLFHLLCSSIAAKIWVLGWRSRALYTCSHHSWAEHMDMWRSLLPAKKKKRNSEDGRAHVQPFSFEPKCKSAAELQECASL